MACAMPWDVLPSVIEDGDLRPVDGRVPSAAEVRDGGADSIPEGREREGGGGMAAALSLVGLGWGRGAGG